MLSFYARKAKLVRIPESIQLIGLPANYVGRHLKRHGPTWAYPATETPFRCQPKTPTARRLIKLVRREDALWPGDETTAQACGVPFTEIEFIEGEWVAKPKPKPQQRKPKKE